VRDAFLGREIEHPIDLRDVRVVVHREPEGEIEPTGTDELHERAEAGLDVATLPTGDTRLRTARASCELGLRETGSASGLTNQISA